MNCCDGLSYCSECCSPKPNDLRMARHYLSNHFDLPYEAMPLEMFDFIKIIEIGAKKYSMNNWLEPDGNRSSEKEMHDSMFHHLAESFAGVREDKDSKLDPLLHLACRALMLYTRRQRGLVHPDDVIREVYENTN